MALSASSKRPVIAAKAARHPFAVSSTARSSLASTSSASKRAIASGTGHGPWIRHHAMKSSAVAMSTPLSARRAWASMRSAWA